MSCNVYGHCLAAHITPPLNINDQLFDIIYILRLEVSDSEAEIMRYNIKNSISTINTNITVKCFLSNGNPYEQLTLTISLSHIYEIESIELH